MGISEVFLAEVWSLIAFLFFQQFVDFFAEFVEAFLYPLGGFDYDRNGQKTGD